MKKQYHVLNRDALFEQFPKSIDGNLVLVRECLVEDTESYRISTLIFTFHISQL